MSLYQTEKVPEPIAIHGVVVSDVASRTLGVRVSERASGYERMWWKTAWQALKAAMEDGWGNQSLQAYRSSDPYVWASTSSAYRVVPVLPADFSMLQAGKDAEPKRQSPTEEAFSGKSMTYHAWPTEDES